MSMHDPGLYWVEVGGLRFEATLHGEQPLVLQSLEGWYDLPDLRGSEDAIPHGNGTFARTAFYRQSAAISVKGLIVAPRDHPTLDTWRTRLTSLLASRPVPMRVSDAQGVWRRIVEVEQVKIVDQSYTYGALEVTIDATAPDPTRYEDEPSQALLRLHVKEEGLVLPQAFPWAFVEGESDRATITNTGTVPAYPTITVQGGAAGEIIVWDTSADRTLSFGRLDAQQTLHIDCAERLATLDGVDATAQLTRRDWWVIPPGESHVIVFIPVRAQKTIQATVQWRNGVF